MTKKNFIELADIIRRHNDVCVKESMPGAMFNSAHLSTLSQFCKEQNPRFKDQLWNDYLAGKCGPNGDTKK
jgi:hypothetical protein